MSRAVVLLSAGLDSVVSFKVAYDTFDQIMCLTFDYAQKALSIETEYAEKICTMYQVNHLIINLPWYASFVGALTDQTTPPPHAVSYTHLRAHETRHDLVCRLL